MYLPIYFTYWFIFFRDISNFAINKFEVKQSLWLIDWLIDKATRVDPILSRALEFVKQGWPQHVEDLRLQHYFNRRFELSVEQDCLLWGLRLSIPTR